MTLSEAGFNCIATFGENTVTKVTHAAYPYADARHTADQLTRYAALLAEEPLPVAPLVGAVGLLERHALYHIQHTQERIGGPALTELRGNRLSGSLRAPSERTVATLRSQPELAAHLDGESLAAFQGSGFADHIALHPHQFSSAADIVGPATVLDRATLN